jgi:hypothetical protein
VTEPDEPQMALGRRAKGMTYHFDLLCLPPECVLETLWEWFRYNPCTFVIEQINMLSQPCSEKERVYFAVGIDELVPATAFKLRFCEEIERRLTKEECLQHIFAATNMQIQNAMKSMMVTASMLSSSNTTNTTVTAAEIELRMAAQMKRWRDEQSVYVPGGYGFGADRITMGPEEPRSLLRFELESGPVALHYGGIISNTIV